MHELSIARSLFEIVKEEAERCGALEVLSIRIKVGALTGIVPESLRFCFTILARDTPAQNAEILVETIPVRGFCNACEESSGLKNCEFLCSKCGSRDIKIISGRELSMEGMEIL